MRPHRARRVRGFRGAHLHGGWAEVGREGGTITWSWEVVGLAALPVIEPTACYLPSPMEDDMWKKGKNRTTFLLELESASDQMINR